MSAPADLSLNLSLAGAAPPAADTDAHADPPPPPPPPPPPMTTTTTAPSAATKIPKRRRLRACDSCRHRKIRCDNQAESCHNCEVYGEKCRITRDGVVLPRVQRPRRRSTASRLSRLSPSVHSSVSGSDRNRPDPASCPNAHASLAQPAGVSAAGLAASTTPTAAAAAVNDPPGPSDSPASSAQRSTSSMIQDGGVPDNNSIASPDFSMTSARTAESGHLEGVVTTEVGVFPKNSKFTGISSAQVLGKYAEEIFQHKNARLGVMDFFCPQMTFAEELPLGGWQQAPLVSKAVANQCLRAYTASYHQFFPILDLHAFHQSYETFYRDGSDNDPARVVCILLVIALGSSPSQSEVFDAHLDVACSLYGKLTFRPYLASVQAFILMTLCLINAGRDGQAILCIGLATQIAQSIGLHRSISTHKNLHEFNFVLRDHNLRNCIWWTCYCLDKKLSLEGGRLSTIRDEDCDADMPLEDVFTPTAASGVVDNPVGFITSLITLCKILSSISTALFNRHAAGLHESELLSRIAAADAALMDWRRALPERFQPDLDAAGGVLSQVGAGLLHSVYYNALLIIHRASLIAAARGLGAVRAHPNPRISSSETICVGAARSLARAVNDLTGDDKDIRVPRWVYPYAINAIFTLYIGIMTWPKKWSCSTDLALMCSLAHCFDQSPDKGAGARFQVLLTCLKADVELAMNSPSDMTPRQQHDYPWPQQQQHQPPPSSSHGVEVNGDGNSQQDRSTGDEWMVTPNSYPNMGPGNTNPLNGSVSGGDFQFGDLFSDQLNLWNMQLWPALHFDGS